jgi:hypothetical protein
LNYLSTGFWGRAGQQKIVGASDWLAAKFSLLWLLMSSMAKKVLKSSSGVDQFVVMAGNHEVAAGHQNSSIMAPRHKNTKWLLANQQPIFSGCSLTRPALVVVKIGSWQKPAAHLYKPFF